MRILRIHIQNLNSLRGEHTIDFTAPPLADHPLYAIVGPTGAGKTTILDAITLALYGLTERTRSATEASKEVATVMTHGTARCRAEVEFETSAGRYRSVWRRRRAHKKVTNDLMSSEREIGEFDPATGDYRILATKKREVSEVTETIVGLDYERFIRSVMLTQGDFDRFLKSKPEEKAAILEQITGTSIYKSLGEGAFLRHKLAREQFERATEHLEQSLPLDPEVRQTLEREITEQTARSSDLTVRAAALNRQLEHYRQLATLTSQFSVTQTRAEQAENAWQALLDDRQRLTDSDRLEHLRASLVEEVQLKNEGDENNRALTATKQQLTTLRVSESERRVTATTARDALEQYLRRAPEREKVLSSAEELTRKLALLESEHRREASRLALHQRTRQTTETERQEIEQTVHQLQSSLGGRSPAALEAALQALETSLPVTEEAILAAEADIAHRRLAKRIEGERRKEVSLQEQLQLLRAQLEERTNLLTAATREVDLQKLRVENIGLRAQVSEHRHRLEEGQPCPLCGATHHPYREVGLETKGELAAANKKLIHLQAELTRYDNAQVKLLREEQAGREKYALLTGLLTELTAQLAPRAPTGTLEELLGRHQQLVEQRTEQQRELRQLRGVRASLPALAKLEADLATAGRKLEEVGGEIKAGLETVGNQEREIENYRQQLTTLLGLNRTIDDLRNAQLGEEAELRQRQEQLTVKATEAGTAVTVAEEREKLLLARAQSLTGRLQELSEPLASELASLGVDRDRARALLLPADRMAPLRERIKRADRERQTTGALLREATVALKAARATAESFPPEEEVKTTAASLGQEITTLERAVGALQEQRERDDRRVARTAELLEELRVLENERDRWAEMSELIGSADGKKFRSFAQSITLQRLVEIGNDHLTTISPRYRMEYAPPPPGGKEELELDIVDRYMNDNRRMMSTLSGGETFLVSLALALGLSDLASGKQLIQSLFIDEGFGTLDGKTLDQAMATLEQLQAQGKTIGIISHVQQLRERVVCQIQLEPVGDGFSRIELAS